MANWQADKQKFINYSSDYTAWEFGVGDRVLVVRRSGGGFGHISHVVGLGTLVKATPHGAETAWHRSSNNEYRTFRLTVKLDDGSTRVFTSRGSLEQWGDDRGRVNLEPPSRLAYWQEADREQAEAIEQRRTYNELKSLVDGLGGRDLAFQRAALKTLKRLIELDNRREAKEV
jgi:hypothetical protein